MAETLPVLVVEDDAPLREALADTLELAGYSVMSADDAEQALAWLDKGSPGLVLSDVQMPGMDGHALLRAIKARHPDIPVLIMTAYGQIERAVEAMRDGASDYLPKPFEPERLLAAVARYYRQESASDESGVVAEDAATQALLDLARRVAGTDTTVLLTGESGVGKEVFARYIHRHSARHPGPFVAVNCAAIPESLLESVLFGHEKGSFTGAATAQAGKFEQANGGILMLDEMAELPLNLQAKLLRVLQEREVERVGGRQPVPLDVRVIAATNRDLATCVREGRFREDLYYRLNVFPLEIMPLRQRRGDIPALARHFLKRFEDVIGRRGFLLSDAALTELTGYDWPGNIRELCNVVQRAMVLAPGAEILPEHLMLPRQSATGRTVSASASSSEMGLKDVERETILDTLRRMGGSRRRTAEALNMSERTLRHKLKQYREAGFLDGDDLL
ncbi:MAG: sigma-54-dependent Fis family transcriptional regulator [Thiobacillus sp.]|nr:sigma-54-dependent Fis family transcriptional regulator [Thiobacillus sp.]